MKLFIRVGALHSTGSMVQSEVQLTNMVFYWFLKKSFLNLINSPMFIKSYFQIWQKKILNGGFLIEPRTLYELRPYSDFC